jgi:hypothetical protein
MTATPASLSPDTSPQLTIPEGSIEGMVAPGQESLLEEFVQEQQQAQEPELLLGKFKSQEDLAKAYQELEKKLGQPAKADPAEPSPAEQGYSAEQAAQVYGKEAVELLAGKGLDLAEVMWQADQGQDISSHYDTLAEAFNVPRQVVENYVSRSQAAAPAESAGLSEQDAAQLKAMVGGEDGFQQLSQWAANNLQPQELADYNAVVDSGNKAAISWALKAIQARVAAPDAVVEPKLIGGGEVPVATKFESQQQVLDAMNKRNNRGEKLYEVDEAYRLKVRELLARSDVF